MEVYFFSELNTDFDNFYSVVGFAHSAAFVGPWLGNTVFTRCTRGRVRTCSFGDRSQHSLELLDKVFTMTRRS